MENITRRELLKYSIGGVVLAGGAALVALLKCNKHSPLQNLENKLGERWDNLSQDRKDFFRRLWVDFREEEKQFIYNSYKNPKGEYEKLDGYEKNFVDSFTKDKLSNGQKQYMEKAFPWINVENPNLSDKIVIERARYAGLQR